MIDPAALQMVLGDADWLCPADYVAAQAEAYAETGVALKALGAPARPVEYCSRVGEVVVAEERAAALRDGPEW